MHNERGERDLRDPFDMFGGFGNFGDFGGSIFGRNPFDDPFFTRPFGTMFDRSSNSSGNSLPFIPPSGPIIQELGSDDDNDEGEQMETEGEQGEKSSTRPDNEPFVDHPDDETNNGREVANYGTDYNRAGGLQARTFKVHSCKVTYGGIDGAYYTSSATRRMGSDGVMMEECKEADKTTGEVTHRISRGLHDKGHSVTRKLNSEGKVDTQQTLHNLNEDELGSFEDAWKGNTGNHLPPWTGSNDGVDRRAGLRLPSSSRMGDVWERGTNHGNRAHGSTKKVVRIPID